MGNKNENTDLPAKEKEYIYVPTYRIQLWEDVERAKGNNTFAEFADMCNTRLPEGKKISRAALSRIMTGTIKTPVEEVYLRAIAESSEGRVSFRSLMSSNGMTRIENTLSSDEEEKNADKTNKNFQEKKEDVENAIVRKYIDDARKSNQKRDKEFDERRSLEKNISATIEKELTERQIKVNKDAPVLDELDTKSRYGLRFIPFGDQWLEAVPEGTAERFELVFYYNLRGSGHVYLDRRAAEPTLNEEMKVSMKSLQGLFLTDMWEPEILKNVRCSVVFIDEKTYRLYCEQLKDIKVHSYISLILLDKKEKEEEYKYKEEYILTMVDEKGKKVDPPESLFAMKEKKQEAPMRNSFEEEEEDLFPTDLNWKERRKRSWYLK